MEEKGRIFLCEDDENLGMLLKEYLQVKDFAVDLFPDGEIGAKNFPKEKYDLCILDVMMPKKDGFALAQEIRSVNIDIPIIFLTAKTMKEDILEGFKIGADDYISKPFSMEELLLRVEAILRRVSTKKPQKEGPFVIGTFTFDPQKQLLSRGESDPVKLTTKESDLLSLLCENVNQVLERNYALKKIWGIVDYFNARSMDVYITKLRKLLRDDPNIEIMNIHGKGYKLIAPVEE
jgi:DNA-binding response OmpR family regulator